MLYNILTIMKGLTLELAIFQHPKTKIFFQKTFIVFWAHPDGKQITISKKFKCKKCSKFYREKKNIGTLLNTLSQNTFSKKIYNKLCTVLAMGCQGNRRLTSHFQHPTNQVQIKCHVFHWMVNL